MAVPLTRPHKLPLGGEAAVKKLMDGNIVDTATVGNATVYVCDDFVATDPDEIESLRRAFGAAGWRMWDEIMARERAEERENPAARGSHGGG